MDLTGTEAAGTGLRRYSAPLVRLGRRGGSVIVLLYGDLAWLLKRGSGGRAGRDDRPDHAPGRRERVRRAARAAPASRIADLSRRALQMTLGYVKERTRFGSPVGGAEATATPIPAVGGNGFTRQADVRCLCRRAQLDAALAGGARCHRAELARHGTDDLVRK